MSIHSRIPTEALEEALAIAGVGCWLWHTKDRQLKVSANIQSMLGLLPGNLPATPEAWLHLAHADDRPQLAGLFEKLAANTARGQNSFNLRLRHASGLWLWFEVRLPAATTADADAPVIITFNDISRATAMVGLNLVRHITLISSLSTFLTGIERTAAASSFWQHSMAVGVCAEKMALLSRHRSAFAVGDALVGLHGRGFATQCEGGGVCAGDVPRVEQIQIGVMGGNVFFVGQASHGVFGGEAGNVVGRLHGALNRSLREVRRAGVTSAVAQVHRHAQ